MSMFVEKENNRIKVEIPNTEATIDAQFIGAKTEVTGYYTNDKEEYKQLIVDFLKDDLEYILDVKKVRELINSIRLSLYDEFKDLYNDRFSSLETSLEFFSKYINGYVRIPKMFYSKNSERYLKFENSDPVVRQLRAVLYGDITGFYIIKEPNNYVISPFLLEDARDILIKKEEIIMKKNISKEISEEEMKEEFKKWMLSIGLAVTTIQNYVGSIDITSREAIEDGLITESIYKMDDVNEVQILLEKLLKNERFANRKVQSNNINSAALSNYIHFLEDRKNDFRYTKNEEWILPANESKFDHSDLEKTGYIDWNLDVNCHVGDLMYLYTTRPAQRISAVLRIEEISEYENNDNKFSKDIEETERSKKYCAKMRKIKDVNDERLSLEELMKHGLTGAPQAPWRVSMELSKYIHSIIDDENEDSYLKEDFLKEVFIKEEKYKSIVSLLERTKNIILEGSPGVGKTFMAKRLAYSIIGRKDESKVKLIQFHQSYSYEDFIEGFRPKENGFVLEKGLFYKYCKIAENDPNEKYYLIIDEINRGNLSKIFGELLMLIEDDKRKEKLTLAYSEEEFSVPSNLYIIGLMNTADRSLALIDYALRRRFSFVRIEPAFSNELFIKKFNSIFNNKFNSVLEAVKEINNDIENDVSLGEDFKIGHSYFCPRLGTGEGNKEIIRDIINYDVLPLLKEYYYDDKEKYESLKTKLEDAIK